MPHLLRRSAVALVVALAVSAGCREDQGIEVKSLRFTGLKGVTESELKAALVTSASSGLPFGPKRYFNRAQFEADLKRIEAFYRDRGYPDARVASFDVQLNDAQDAASISITIQEGEPILVEAMRFEGFEALPRDRFEALTSRVQLKAGQRRDRQLVQAARESALDEFKEHGYPYARVEVVEEEGAAPRSSRLVFRAEPGPVARFGPVDIAGNMSVGENVIRRQLTYRPGELFRLSALRESQRRLYSLELFEFANVQQADPEREQPEVPTRITVAEGKHRKVDFGFGFGTEEKGRAQANWRHVNFFGGARSAGVEAKWSSLDRGIRLNFREPYVISRQYSLTASGQLWFANEPAYSLDTRGARLTLTRQIGRRFQLGHNAPTGTDASISLVHESESYSIATDALLDLSFRDTLIALGLDPRTGSGGGTLSAIDADLHRSTSDSVLNPTHGYVASLHVEQAGRWLPGDFDYTETTLEGRYYVPFGRVVLANRLKAGTITGPAPIGEHVPFFKRYFIGGATSLRGWGRFQVSPLSGSGLPIGGHSVLDGSIELRAPVRGNFGAVAFIDGGNVWPDRWRFDVGDLRYDAGIGLRYFTRIGPIRFDVAKQLTIIPGLLVRGKPETRHWRMHFSIGQAF